MTEPLLSGVVVHWRNEEHLAELLAAWPRDPRFELIVVDNGSEPPLAAAPPARLLVPGRNLGFAGGANAGIAAARAPLVLLLNPDAVPEPGALEALLDGFAAHPEAAGLAPRLAGPDGAAQHAWQLRRLPSAREVFLQVFLVPPPTGERREPPAGTPVEQPAAAALALRREALAAASGLDPGFHPAWFEDVDLARRLRAAGLPILYWPAARFRHHLAGTVPRLGYGPFLWIYNRNLVRYLAKHHGRGWAAAARAALPLGMALRIALLPLRKPRRAATRREAARGLLGVAAGALSGWRRPQAWAAEWSCHPERERFRATLPPDPSLSLGMTALVAVCIVTHNSRDDLPACLAAVGALDHRPLELVVVDCASRDGSLERARAAAPTGIPLTAVQLADNRGFAGGMNEALARTTAPFVLTLNADARPQPPFVTRLLARLEAPLAGGARAGAVAGRLLRAGNEGPRLDACGMRLSPAWRHFDRGSGEPDGGQYSLPERVFGATGAASLFRREALLDAAVDGEVFDPRFHSFREDAELCFRLRERGWEVLYEPAAAAEHRRRVLPERRAALPPAVNFHSLKNRYLLRLYHQTAGNFLWTLPFTLARDLLALGYVLLRERSSLPAYGWLWRHRRELMARRRAIRARRRVPPRAIDRWFLRAGEPL
ncbi:MAG TPA: glycosyltransferase [Thermoanaerobaculia bacterium]